LKIIYFEEDNIDEINTNDFVAQYKDAKNDKKYVFILINAHSTMVEIYPYFKDLPKSIRFFKE